MSEDKKRVSIHDYPEHLNPFSESHFTVQDRRQVIADKLHTCKKNRTLSKISKRVSRSVSWLEKSLLTSDESSKKTRESQICNEKHEIEHSTHPSPVNRLSKTNAYFEVDIENNSPSRLPQIPPDQNEEVNIDQKVKKTEIKKRKKRPAPLPPIGDNSSSCSRSDDTESNQHRIESEDNKHIDDIDVVKLIPTITSTETSSNPFDEEITQTCSIDTSEQPVPVVNDDDLSTIEIIEHDMQNLAIIAVIQRAESENNAEEAAQHSKDDHKVSEMPNSIRDDNESSSTNKDVICDEIKSNDNIKSTEHPPITPRRRIHTLDENANIPCVKSKPRRDDLLSEMHCNGKAVMV